MKRILFTLLLLVGYVYLNAQPNLNQSVCFGGTSFEKANSMQFTYDGGFIMAGAAFSIDGDVTGNNGLSDFWVVKLNKFGDIEWQKNFGGSQNDIAESVTQTNDGGYMVAGYSKSSDGDVPGNYGSDDYFVIRLDTEGNIIWKKNFGGSKMDRATTVVQSLDGGFVVLGYTMSNDHDVSGNHGDSDVWIVKLDGDGNLIWQHCYGGSDSEETGDICVDSAGGYAFVAASCSDDGDVGSNWGHADYWIVNIDNNGNINWKRTLGGGNDDIPNSIKQTLGGGYIVGGEYNSSDNSYSVMKLDDYLGELKWRRNLGGNNNEGAFDVIQTSDRGYLAIGYTKSNDGDVTGNHGGKDIWMVKLKFGGQFEWEACYGGSADETGFAIREIAENSYVVAGETFSNDGDVSGNHGQNDFWFMSLCTPDTLSVVVSDSVYCYSTTIMAEGNFVDWLWSSGETSQSITVDTGGIYSVQALNGYGCVSSGSVMVNNPVESVFDTANICLVTFDEEQGKNLIVYEPSTDEGIDSVLLFRKNDQNGIYELVAANGIEDMNLFVDPEADPSLQSFMYKAAYKDTCGKTGEMSFVHSTVYLSAVADSNRIDLFWNYPEGFEFSDLEIYRRAGDGDFEKIETVTGQTISYTDADYPQGKKEYQVRINKEQPCEVAGMAYSVVASNIVTVNYDGIDENRLDDIRVFPNPFIEVFTVKREKVSNELTVELIDIYGRTVRRYLLPSGEKSLLINTAGLQPGVWFLRFNKSFVKRVVKQ